MELTSSKPIDCSLKEYKEDIIIYEKGFREYDARWRYPEQINLPGLQNLGISLGKLILKNGVDRNIVVGHDFRSYSEEVKEALVAGLVASGMNVYDIGLTITPGAYFAQYFFDCMNVAMVTASHNPNGWTGVKMGLNRPLTFETEQMKALKEISLSYPSPSEVKGTYIFQNINKEYLKDLTNKKSTKRKIKAVVACGNGTAGMFAPKALKKIGIEVIPLHCDLDNTFPNYNPNPEDMLMLKDLSKKVLETNSDVGFAFDGDGDRCGFVDDRGREIFADKIGLLIARKISKETKNSLFITDIKSTSLFSSDEVLKNNNSEVLYWKTGHSYIKKKTFEKNAIAGFERSGHYFFNKPIGRGYDDGILSAIELCKLMDKEKTIKLSELYDELPITYCSPTMSPQCSDHIKYEIVNKITSVFENMEKNEEKFSGQMISSLITINGVRVSLEDGSWGLIRASSNSPNLVVVCESPISKERMKEIFISLDKILKSFPEVGEYDQKI